MLQQVGSIQELLNDDKVRVSLDISNLQDADLSNVLSDLSAKETALRLVFASSGRVFSTLNNIQLGN